ncbi:HNH endonuclease [Streptomyces sp. NPDC048376]|uniref:HNH endonuclease n=1 Tax=Streptomyces sp. NPDC048376 TaxID=3154926 RepID=UPI0034320541
MANPRRKQCGKPDCKRAFNADRVREWNRAYKAEHGLWPHHRYGEGQRARERRRRLEKGHWRKLYPESAAAYDARRRALVSQARTGEVFAPLDIHTRDGWVCQLCHEPIDQTIAWPHPKSPSIDHIIPLSRGGAHALSNVQSAHLGCNSSKRDRDTHEAAVLLARLAGQA